VALQAGARARGQERRGFAAPVQGQAGAADVGGPGRGQEQARVGHVVGGRHPAQRHTLLDASRGWLAAFAAVYECAVPVIAAVHGVCLGGGVGLAGNADIVIAAKDPAVIRLAKQALNGIDPVDVKRSYRYEQGFTYELTVAGSGDRARQAFVDGKQA
jgi:hypothetical protein